MLHEHEGDGAPIRVSVVNERVEVETVAAQHRSMQTFFVPDTTFPITGILPRNDKRARAIIMVNGVGGMLVGPRDRISNQPVGGTNLQGFYIAAGSQLEYKAAQGLLMVPASNAAGIFVSILDEWDTEKTV